jgi:hypothetical protein
MSHVRYELGFYIPEDGIPGGEARPVYKTHSLTSDQNAYEMREPRRLTRPLTVITTCWHTCSNIYNTCIWCGSLVLPSVETVLYRKE